MTLTMADVPLDLRQSQDEATLREALALANLVEAEAPSRLVAWLRDGLESAGDPVELKAAWARVVRYGHSLPDGTLSALLDVAARRLAAMRKAEQQAVSS